MTSTAKWMPKFQQDRYHFDIKHTSQQCKHLTSLALLHIN